MKFRGITPQTQQRLAGKIRTAQGSPYDKVGPVDPEAMAGFSEALSEDAIEEIAWGLMEAMQDTVNRYPDLKHLSDGEKVKVLEIVDNGIRNYLPFPDEY